MQDAAVGALEEMDVPPALALVAEARERDPALPGLDRLQNALTWLASVTVEKQPAAENIARAWRELPVARRTALLRPDSATFLDEALARLGLRAIGLAEPFLDTARTVHRGALSLLLGRSARGARAAARDARRGVP